jgi:hypothetical protein
MGTKGKPFTLHHFRTDLENDEKWKKSEMHEIPRRSTKSSMGYAAIVDGGDEASSDEGKISPPPLGF